MSASRSRSPTTRFVADFTGSSPQVPGPINCTRTRLQSACRTIFKAIADPATPGQRWLVPPGGDHLPGRHRLYGPASGPGVHLLGNRRLCGRFAVAGAFPCPAGSPDRRTPSQRVRHADRRVQRRGRAVYPGRAAGRRAGVQARPRMAKMDWCRWVTAKPMSSRSRCAKRAIPCWWISMPSTKPLPAMVVIAAVWV